jgi:2-succinyl-5-enolpyruvyl-6-hydroxy-3-cyclohexene-1-carboxylate synthase
MMNKHYYTDEKNAQIVVALLKAHGVRKVVANPGTTNISFVGSVQNDPWFEVYSGIDERHSAYMAVGMAAESGEAVVLSCTGATASRNYLSALTEAYYRKLPVLALTSLHHMNSAGNLLPQMIDRTIVPKDVARYSLQCPVPQTEKQIQDCVSNVNRAILELFRAGGGPVHINLETERGFSFTTKQLPEYRVIRRKTAFAGEWPNIPEGAKVAVWIGSHRRFLDKEISLIDKFSRLRNAVVLVDKTSSFGGGACAVDSSLICLQPRNGEYSGLAPDLVIQIGEVSGDYPTMDVMGEAKEVWRVGEDGELRDLFNKLTWVFEMPESTFFGHYASDEQWNARTEYFEKWNDAMKDLRSRIPDVPFSNIWMASVLHSKFPSGSVLHLGILNSLRAWNLFALRKDIESASNVGGFGIDGCLSTMIGASIVSPHKLFFGVFGDLAFFYDMNALGNHHIGKNIRILLVNNGCGAEFVLSSHPASKFGAQTLDYMAAGNHFGNKSTNLVKHYAQDLGFNYLCASTKEEFISCMDRFLSGNEEAPIIFECFTAPEDESKALESVRGIAKVVDDGRTSGLVSRVKAMVPPRIKNAVRELLK